MRRIFSGFLLASIAMKASGFTPHQSLEAVISHPESKRDAESGVVIFTMTNRSYRPINVLRLQTPFNTTGERLTNNLFDVVDGRGEEATYTSMYVGMVAGSDGLDEKQFIKLNPGESLSRRIDLSKSYDLSTGGPFKVTFNRAVLGERSNRPNNRNRLEPLGKNVTSNTLDLWINDAFFFRKSASIEHAQQGTACEASQQSVIDAALSKAITLASDANHYNASLWYFEGEVENFTVKLK